MQTQFIFMSLKATQNARERVKQQTSDNYDVGSARQCWRLNKPIKCVDTWKSARISKIKPRS